MGHHDLGVGGLPLAALEQYPNLESTEEANFNMAYAVVRVELQVAVLVR